jgi:hypothetical protein
MGHGLLEKQVITTDCDLKKFFPFLNTMAVPGTNKMPGL